MEISKNSKGPVVEHSTSFHTHHGVKQEGGGRQGTPITINEQQITKQQEAVGQRKVKNPTQNS